MWCLLTWYLLVNLMHLSLWGASGWALLAPEEGVDVLQRESNLHIQHQSTQQSTFHPVSIQMDFLHHPASCHRLRCPSATSPKGRLASRVLCGVSSQSALSSSDFPYRPHPTTVPICIDLYRMALATGPMPPFPLAPQHAVRSLISISSDVDVDS